MDEIIVSLSALQHWLYCPRQCALIYVERLWEENVYTAEGRVLHERTDLPQMQRRHGVKTVTAMMIADETLGIAGVADVVEFYRQKDQSWQAYPVEYKRGRPKAHRADEVQLCAQALCLEAMLGQPVPEGALFYGKTRRRVVVALDETLRALTKETILAVRALIAEGKTPLAVYEAKRCGACSLLDGCQPRLSGRGQAVGRWLARQIAAGTDEERMCGDS